VPAAKRSCLPSSIALATLLVSAAGAYAQAPASNRAKSTSAAKTPVPAPGSVHSGVYGNRFFGFAYKIPFGWVDRTTDLGKGDALQPDQMQESDKRTNHTHPESVPGQAWVLLAVFARPPEATGDLVNSAVVIAAETVSSYPGLKTAADYFGPLTEVTTAQGFKLVDQPYEFPLGGQPLVRADFSKELGRLTMYQASLVRLHKGYILSFTFIGGSGDAVQELIDGLSFVSPPSLAKRKPARAKH
jgi:hypothetical protein